jgi:hypothetical protein
MRLEEITAKIEAAEARVAEIDETFCAPGYFENTPKAESSALERERTRLLEEVERLMQEWGELEGSRA